MPCMDQAQTQEQTGVGIGEILWVSKRVKLKENEQLAAVAKVEGALCHLSMSH